MMMQGWDSGSYKECSAGGMGYGQGPNQMQKRTDACDDGRDAATTSRTDNESNADFEYGEVHLKGRHKI